MGMEPRQVKDADAVHHQPEVAKTPESAHDEATRLAMQCHGDPAALAKLVSTLPQKLLAQVVEVAQQRFGNHFVRDALSHATMAAPVGMLDGDITKTGGVGETGPLTKSGVHGEGLGGLVHAGGNGDRKNTVTSVSKFSGADDMRYGDTFGGGRMAGDGAQINGDLAKLGGNRRGATDDERGNTSMFDNTVGPGTNDVCKTPGDPSATPYPNADGKAPGGGSGPINGTPGNDVGAGGGTRSGNTSGNATHFPATSSSGGGGTYIHVPGTRMPTDDADTGGSGAPVTVNAAQHAAAQNLINHQRDAHKNVTDGGDGRGETGSPSGGTSGIGVAQRDKVDGKVEHEQGTLDLDKALQINQVVNPGRT